jgi:hypothetical protein
MKQYEKVTQGISKAIKNVDESLSYIDLAKAISEILKEDYGSHNIEPFMNVLKQELQTKTK